MRRKTIDLIFIVVQAICIVGLFTTNSFDYMRIAIGDLIFWLVYIILELKQKWTIPLYIRTVVILSILSNSVFGEFINLYVSSVFYDRLQHIFGTYSMTLWAFFVIQQFVKIRFINKKFIIIFIVSLSVTLGTFYEINEFFQDEFFKPIIKNQPSLLDTDLDLISDLLGGIIALFHYLFSTSLKSFKFPFEEELITRK
ncbi:hypothetical protein [Metabacillus fastidiosus]|uniref:hypothetical protein n=1 Tax=Metabacillus fastidiosus TaxID=1458 RepID=UPI003D2D05AD